MSAQLWYLVVDVANVLCAMLIGARVILAFPAQRNAQLIALICLSVICHTILSRYEYGAWFPQPFRIDLARTQSFLDILRNLAPGLLMILVHRLFTDRRRVPAWLLAAFAVEIFLEKPVTWVFPSAALSPIVTELAPTLLQTLFAGLALYWTLSNWRVDLIEARRRMRVIATVLLSVQIVASSLFLRVIIPQNIYANFQAYRLLAIFNLAVLAFLLLRLASVDLREYLDAGPIRRERQPAAPPDNGAALARLTRLLTDKRVYREPGLSLKGLADQAGLPEYKLRRLIHDELGYRNFNAFLHDQRIKEACDQLRDPTLRRLPILTIALSVGYQSLNTFNRGFRETMGVTPSAFRSQAEDHQKPQSDPNFANRPTVPEIGEP